MVNRIELVVFDMAGTTVQDNREVEHCFMEAIHDSGLHTDHNEINSMMGWSKKLVFESLWKKNMPDEKPEVIQKQSSKSYATFKTILENHYANSPVLPARGCIELFEFLHKNDIKIALTTGFYRQVTDIILKRLGWDKGLDSYYAGDGLINASVTSDQVSFGRPAPYMVFRAMELCRVHNVRNVLKLGDTPSDLKEGLNAGCRFSMGVTNGTHTREELMKFENSGLVRDLQEFKIFVADLLLSIN